MQGRSSRYARRMTISPRPRSPLWMVVLALACEEPMHPYRMQALIKQRGKDRVANVAQRNSVYQTIEALLRARLIEVRETSRDDNRPERTVYAATDEGRRTMQAWIRTVLATPAREFPDFPAALSLLGPDLKPAELRALLEARAAALERRLAGHEGPFPELPRMFLLEEEYLAAIVRAEIAWLRGVIEDLRSGRLKPPTEAELRRLSALPGAPSEAAIQQIAAQTSRRSHLRPQPAGRPTDGPADRPGRPTGNRSRQRR
jgi:DNA-binding PadR family transcriptional regulator